MGLVRFISYNIWRINRLDYTNNYNNINTMKIIKNKYIPFGHYKTINIFGILFTKGELNKYEINHEQIHTEQMKEMLYIFFYIWYLIEYLIIKLGNLFKSQSEQYHEISFEEEAYNNQANLDYIKNRKRYAWFKYINIHSS